MSLKPSYYNFLFEYSSQNKSILYNSLSQASLLIDNLQDLNSLKVALAQPNDESLAWHATLKKNRFLVAKDLDELKILETRFHSGQKQKDLMNITVACTIQCNFRCTYCFEPHRNEYLSDEHFAKLLEVIVAKARDYKKLQITWFGGEPLLMIHKIASWSKVLIETLKPLPIEYQSTIVTNGSLLSEKNILKLLESNVLGLQVTIDGAKEFHDRSRPSIGQKGTYDKIIANFVKNYDLLAKLNPTIRVNVYKNNISGIEELLIDLNRHSIEKMASIYFARVENSTSYCGDISSTCYSSKEFSQELIQLNQLREKYGFAGDQLPASVHAFCGALSEGSFVIDAAGDLFKCWHDVGNQNKRYSTIEKQHDNLFQLAEYQNYSHYEDEDCRTCKVLPLCQGNCPYYRIGDRQQKQCTPLKYNLKNHIKQVYGAQFNS